MRMYIDLAVFQCLSILPDYSCTSYWLLVREKPLGRKRKAFEKLDLRAGCAGLTRGSPENNSRVVLAPPASDPFLAGRDL